MSWTDDVLRKMNERRDLPTKEDVKESIRTAAHELMGYGFDWDDIEIYVQVVMRPALGDLIHLIIKWLREIRDEERKEPVN